MKMRQITWMCGWLEGRPPLRALPRGVLRRLQTLMLELSPLLSFIVVVVVVTFVVVVFFVVFAVVSIIVVVFCCCCCFCCYFCCCYYYFLLLLLVLFLLLLLVLFLLLLLLLLWWLLFHSIFIIFDLVFNKYFLFNYINKQQTHFDDIYISNFCFFPFQKSNTMSFLEK